MKEQISIGDSISSKRGYKRTPVDGITVRGKVHARLIGPDGKVKGEWKG